MPVDAVPHIDLHQFRQQPLQAAGSIAPDEE
jgi:hypothetical protein